MFVFSDTAGFYMVYEYLKYPKKESFFFFINKDMVIGREMVTAL